MRSVRNLVAPPIVIITDSKEFAFNFPTRFRIDVSSHFHPFRTINRIKNIYGTESRRRPSREFINISLQAPTIAEKAIAMNGN